MNKSTASLSFPDINVWMALILEHHAHRFAAQAWWNVNDGPICFTRFTQIGLLRLLTTHAAIDGKPLAFVQAADGVLVTFDRALASRGACL